MLNSLKYFFMNRSSSPNISSTSAANLPSLSPEGVDMAADVSQVSNVESVPNIFSRIGSHVTKESNLQSIMREGLDPKYGGSNGGGFYKKSSQGKVHFGIETECSVRCAPANRYSVLINQPIELNIGLRKGIKFEEDLADGSPGIYFTREKVNPDEIIPMPLRTAFRKAGEIGADYSPSGFVHAVIPSDSKSEAEKIEAIRKTVWETAEPERTLEALIKFGDIESAYTKTKTMDDACKLMSVAIQFNKLEVVKCLMSQWEGINKKVVEIERHMGAKLVSYLGSDRIHDEIFSAFLKAGMFDPDKPYKSRYYQGDTIMDDLVRGKATKKIEILRSNGNFSAVIYSGNMNEINNR